MTERIPYGELTFLGTGTSHGVPMIGCTCSVCQSADSRNRRTRSSVVLGFPDGNLLIDTSPDLREQFLRERVRTAHAILFTHAHVDHLFGLDETRIFSRYNDRPSIPVFCDASVDHQIRKCFDYIFDSEVQKYPAGGIPKLDLNLIRPGIPFTVLGQEVFPLTMLHGKRPILGFRIGNFAYCTDVKTVPPQSEALLHGLDTLVLGCLRYRPHVTHMGLEEALAFVERIQPKRTFFTHLCHDFEHETLSSELPRNVRPAFDGLKISFA